MEGILKKKLLFCTVCEAKVRGGGLLGEEVVIILSTSDFSSLRSFIISLAFPRVHIVEEWLQSQETSAQVSMLCLKTKGNASKVFQILPSIFFFLDKR